MLPKFRDLLKPKKPPSPASWEELFQQARSLHQQGQPEGAIELYGQCIARAPDRAQAYYERANALNGLRRLEPALEDYDRAIGLDPNDALTHYNRGSVLKDLKRYADAFASYESAVRLNGDFAEAYVNRGCVLQELWRHEAAIESFERAIALNPAIAQAFHGLGVSLHRLGRLEQALAAYNKAVALKPDLAIAYHSRAHLFADLNRHGEAITDYFKAIELEPDPATYQSIASYLVLIKRVDLAIESLDEAIALDPDGPYLLGTSRATKMVACSWDGLGEDLERIAKGVSERRPVCDPRSLAGLIDSAPLQRSAAEIIVRDQYDRSCEADLRRIAEISPAPLSRPRSARIRIGYFSSDFRIHPVAYLTAGLFERHDRTKFEVTAFAFGPEASDEMVSRLTKAFDRFIDVRQKSDFEVAALARELGIDIAIDLNGFTAYGRPRIFALRAAPIQINFLGYPGTMGAGFMDYLIADGMVVPREQRRHYVEKIAYLPGSCLPFDSRYAIADRAFSREELGLPSEGFVFCCFNSSYKILPEVFDRWMRILSRTGNSVLWLQQSDAIAAGNLRQEASRRGIDGGRLIFAGRMASRPEHLARLRAADLFLDTLPYNAHATALDSLWAGVPLLTYPGESFASRVAASLVRTVGLPELIAGSPSQYEETAVELALDPARLGQLRRKLALRDTPLFDTEHYTRNLEAVYETIYERHHSGSPPDHINEHLATSTLTSTTSDSVMSAPSAISWEELFQRAQSLHQQGQPEGAIELYGQCIERAPERAEAYYKRANALNGLGRLEPALEDYDRAIRLNPSYTYAFCNRGSVLERLGRREEALASYDRALELDPKDALTHYNRGSVLKDLKRYEAALASYESAIGLNGNYAEAYVNRGSVLQELWRHEAAIESFERAIALNPAIAHAFHGLGGCLHRLKRLEQALAAYNKAIALKPDFAAAYLARGGLLADLDRHTEATTDYLKATELEPDPQAYQSLASSLVRLKRFDLAIASLDKAIALDPDGHYLLGTCRATKMHACSWDGLGEDLERITKGVSEQRPVCNPLTLAALIDSAALQRSAAEIMVRDQIDRSCEEDLKRIAEISPAPLFRPRSARIRIGYFSADFRAHPVAYLTAGLFERHDRTKFEVTAFAFGPEARDPMASRLTKSFDRFIDVRQKSDLEVAVLARELGIDIAIDLNGFTAHCRTRIFALRAAPIQINFLGYPGTMGAGFVDYLIADGIAVPREQQRHYVEKIAYLPGSFLPFDSRYAIADRTFTREELGLPSTGFVFCCFNNSYKILPEVFDRWMRILSRTKNSVLWLQQAGPIVAGNLRREASRRGVDGGRLIFADRMESLPEHLARLRAVDLFLDTFPYNAHATALDSLWAGVPLLTYPGESFASRVAVSLVRTVGLPELIAGSPSQYEETAVELALDPARLGQLRRKLALRDTPLFDTEHYTRNLEAVYETIYERHHSGSPPDHINEHLAT